MVEDRKYGGIKIFNLSLNKEFDTTIRNGQKSFMNRYNAIALPTTEQLPYLDPIILPENKEVFEHQRETIIACLVFASPPSQQARILSYFSDYLLFTHDLFQFIYKIWREPNPQSIYSAMEVYGDEGLHTVKRIKNMIEVSTNRLQNQGLSEEEYHKRFLLSIKFLVAHEFGDSMFKLHSVYKKMNV